MPHSKVQIVAFLAFALPACAASSAGQRAAPLDGGVVLGLRSVSLARFDEATETKRRTDRRKMIAEERTTIDARRNQIQIELGTMYGEASAGYFWDRSCNFKVAPKGGVAYYRAGDMGVYDANHGDIIDTAPDCITVAWVIDPSLSKSFYMGGIGRQSLSSLLWMVTWGDRQYLVPDARMVTFCNDVSNGIYLLYPFRMLNGKERPRGPKSRWVPPGLPDVPLEYRVFLRQRPTDMPLIEIGPTTILPFRGGTITLVQGKVGAGSSSGLLPGMQFPLEGHVGEAEIVSTTETVSHFRCLVSHGRALPRVGDLLNPSSQR